VKRRFIVLLAGGVTVVGLSLIPSVGGASGSSSQNAPGQTCKTERNGPPCQNGQDPGATPGHGGTAPGHASP